MGISSDICTNTTPNFIYDCMIQIFIMLCTSATTQSEKKTKKNESSICSIYPNNFNNFDTGSVIVSAWVRLPVWLPGTFSYWGVYR